MSDAELIAFAKEFRDGILAGRDSTRMCFAVCWSLQTLLEATGIKSRMINGNVEGWDHCWLELSDGRILDPTADQFPNLWEPESENAAPPVYLGLWPAWYDPEPILFHEAE